MQATETTNASQDLVNTSVAENVAAANAALGQEPVSSSRPSPEETLLNKVAENGGHLDAKCKDAKQFAKRWQAELKLNEQLRKQYEEVGTNYSKQREFKKKWVTMKSASLRQVRLEKESSSSLEEIDGEYCTFSRIVCREGNDAPAYSTACTYTASAVALWSSGKTCKGFPWIKYDAMRKMAVILHIRDRVRVGHTKQWEITTTMPTETSIGTPTAPPASSAGSSTGTSTVASTSDLPVACPQKTEDPVKTDDTAPKDDPQPNKDPEGNEGEPPNKKAKLGRRLPTKTTRRDDNPAPQAFWLSH